VTRRGWTLFLTMSVIWGIPYLLIRVADEAVSPAVLVLARTSIGALIIVPLAAARGELRPVLKRCRLVLLYTAVEVAIPWVLLSWAERRLASSLTGLLIAAVPLVGTLLVRAAGERNNLGRSGIAGLAVGIAGVGVLVGFDVKGANLASFGALAVVVVGYALGPFIISRSLSDIPSSGVVAASLLVTAVIYAPIGLTELPRHLPPGRVLASLVGLGVICTAVAFLLFFELIAEIGPVRATVITYVNPAVAVLLGVLLLGESFTLATAAGFVLILGGSVLATGAGRRSRVAPAYTDPVPGGDPVNGTLGQRNDLNVPDPSSTPEGRSPTGGTTG